MRYSVRRLVGLPAPVVVIIVLAALVAPRVLQPLYGDQALSLEIGRRLLSGEHLYRDVWDIRYPGSMVWFAVVGSVIGTSAIGLRIAEFCWLAGLAALISHDVTRQAGRRAGIVAGLATVGPLFWMARSTDVAQPDTLALVVLYLLFRVTLRPTSAPLTPVRAVAIGLGAIVLAMFKITLAPLPALFVLVHLWTRRPPWGDTLRGLAWMIGGCLIGVGAVVAALAANGDVGWVAHTWFVQGPSMRSIEPPPIERLARSIGRVVVFASPVVIGAAIGLVNLIRRHRADRDAWTLGAATWLVAASLLLLPQQWWSYQWMSLAVPLGLLATPTLARILSSPRRVVTACVVVLVLSLFSDPRYFRALADHGLHPAAIAADLQPGYRNGIELQQLFANDPPDSVYAFANPLAVLEIDRDPKIAVHGWSTEFYDDTTWRRLNDEFALHPPEVVLIDEFTAPIVAAGSPHLSALLADDYEEVAQLTGGVRVLRRVAGD